VQAPDLPAHLSLRKEDLPFWNAILRARSWDEWGQIELVLAWQLAQIQGDIKTVRALIEKGDRKKLDDAGYPSVRAASVNVSSLITQQLTLMRSLVMVGTVVGDPALAVPRRQAEREAEQTINAVRSKPTKSLLAL
jgi:hypothetical protein